MCSILFILLLKKKKNGNVIVKTLDNGTTQEKYAGYVNEENNMKKF